MIWSGNTFLTTTIGYQYYLKQMEFKEITNLNQSPREGSEGGEGGWVG